MSVIAHISLKIILHLNVLNGCLISIIIYQVCEPSRLCSLGLTLIIPLVSRYFRFFNLKIGEIRWLASFMQLKFILILILMVLEFRLSLEIILILIYVLLLIIVFLICKVILVLEIVVGINITVVGYANRLPLESIWFDDIGGLKRILNWVEVQV